MGQELMDGYVLGELHRSDFNARDTFMMQMLKLGLSLEQLISGDFEPANALKTLNTETETNAKIC